MEGGLGSTEGAGICHSYTPDGRCVSLLKILLTNYCIYDCRYCVNRVSSDIPRARFTPDEVVQLTLDFYRRNYIEGLFLSSGIVRSPDHTMEQLVEVARALREDHGFAGYIHLKAIPAASPELLEAAGRLADRVSCNVELPTEEDLARLAPEKRVADIHGAMDTMRRAVESEGEGKVERRPGQVFLPAGQSTQMIVGATGTADADILHTAHRLYEAFDLRRVYYSAYSPIPQADARLPSARTPLMREHRLYQADWLLRFYGFGVDEIVPDEAPQLPLDMDPKLAWALRHRDAFPVDVNRAPREQLLRVPGLGRRTARSILRIRRHHAVTYDDLRRLRVPLRRARPFLVAAGHGTHASWLDRADLPRLVRPPEQLELFSAPAVARMGEL